MTALKIAYVIDCLDSVNGGTERQLPLLIEGMMTRGHKVALYVMRESEFTKKVRGFPCAIHNLGVESLLSVAGVCRLLKFRQEMIRTQVDVVHGFFNDVAMALPVVMCGSGIRVFTSRRDMGVWYTCTRLAVLRLLRFLRTRVICNSEAVAECTIEKEWMDATLVSVIHNGIGPMSEDADMSGCDWVPRKRDGPEILNVVLVANIRPVKRIEDLIRAARRVADRGYRLRYYVVGRWQDSTYTDWLRCLVRECQLEEAFRFVGPVAEPRCGLDRCDIGVLTSASEGCSNAIIEYLDAGLAVVASRVAGNMEIVREGVTGLLYELGRDDALAECLEKLVVDWELRETIRSNGKVFARQFGAADMVEAYVREYYGTPEQNSFGWRSWRRPLGRA